MPPADPAALRDALATVRQHWAEPERYSAVYLPALELIARHSISLLDAGELVRVRGLEWTARPIGDYGGCGSSAK